MSNENPRSNSLETPEGKLFAELVNASDSEITDCKFESEPYSGPDSGPSYNWTSTTAKIKGHSVEFSGHVDDGGGWKQTVSIDGTQLDYSSYHIDVAEALQERLDQIADKASK